MHISYLLGFFKILRSMSKPIHKQLRKRKKETEQKKKKKMENPSMPAGKRMLPLPTNGSSIRLPFFSLATHKDDDEN